VAIYAELGGKRLTHPREVYEYAITNRTPTDFWQRANSYTCGRGEKPGQAWVLMTRKLLDELGRNEFHTLRFVDGKTIIDIENLSIVKSSTMSQSVAGDARAPRLVYLEDKRRQLQYSSINAQYNVRIPAPSTTSGTGLYYTASLNSGSVWTWQTLATNLWASLPSTVAGTAPALPYTPDGTPEGWRFIGVSAWRGLHVVLEKIGCTTVYDPILDVFTYVQLGVAQTGLLAALDRIEDRKLYDYDPQENYQLANMPEKIRVFFARRETYHGIEMDTPLVDNWEMSPAVSKDYATAIAGAQAGTIVSVWDDLPALFDYTNLNTNSAALQTRANEIGLNIVRRIDVSEERLRRTYSGLVKTIIPGAEISELIWRDYGDGGGLVTEIVRRPITERIAQRDKTVDEHLATLDLSRPSYPVHPRVAQLVQVDDGASATGADLTANVDGLFPGFVIRWTAVGYDTLEACWIRPSDLSGVSESAIVQLKQKDRLIARLYGIATSGGSTRPVYLVRKGEAGSAQPQFMIQVAGTPDGRGQASEETAGGTPVCVWDANLVTPAQVSGELCGDGTNTLGTAGWFAFLGSDAAADPYFLTHGGKFVAYSAGFDFTPTDGVARPLYLAAKDQETFYFKASENWRIETFADTVLCNPAEDVDGINVDTGVTKTIYLPQVAEMDPNVVTGDVIAARLGQDGKFVCVSDYLDDKIGTVKMWSGSVAAIPPGWEVMDGSANSAVAHGSGISLIDRFVRGSLSAGEQGGNKEHWHNLFVFVEGHSQFELAVALDHTHEASVDNHTVAQLRHNHPINLDTPSLGWKADYEAWTPDQARRVGCTGDPVEPDLVCLLAGAWGPLTHTVNIEPAYPEGGTASGLVHITSSSYMDPADHTPEYASLIFIERVNNAVNA